MKVLVLALSTGTGVHGRNEDAQRQTWAIKNLEQCEVYWMKSQKNSPAFTADRNLMLRGIESFDGILGKTIAGIDWAFDNLDFDYILRTNTSTYLHIPSLLKLINEPETYQSPQGSAGIWSSESYRGGKDISYISGSCMVIPRDFAGCLREVDAEAWSGVPDDVAISEILANEEKAGNFFSRMDRVNITDFEPLRPSANTRVKSLRYSAVTAKRMHAIHAIYESSDIDQLKFRLTEFDSAERMRYLRERHSNILNLPFITMRQIQSFESRLEQFKKTVFKP